MQAYCVKCHLKREIANTTEVQMKNGKPAVKGTCATCGTTVFKIGRSEETIVDNPYIGMAG